MTTFRGIIAAFCRDDYIISDTAQSLGYNGTNKRWRDLGVGFNGIYYNTETAVIAATLSSKVVSFEAEGSTNDNGVAIPLSIEPGHASFDDDMERILHRVMVDVNANSNSITVTLIHDGTETPLGIISDAGRSRTEINVGITGHSFGIRLTGSITGEVNLYRTVAYFNDLNKDKDQ